MVAIEANAISKQFRIYHERYQTLKERVIHLGRQSYELFWALQDVDLRIDSGETVGLIGANGSGKSTFLKITAGILEPTSGVIATNGRLAALLELGAGFHPDLTGRENVFMNASILGLSKKETQRHFDEIVGFAELERFIDSQVKHYSSGMYIRLGFSVAVHVNPEILLVDEVLAVGDEAFQKKCLDRIKGLQEAGCTILFVTHAVDVVKQICDRAVLLEQGRVAIDGTPGEVVRRFRESIHEEKEGPGRELGTREVEVIDCVILNGSGSRQDQFVPGDDVTIRIDLEPNGSLAEVVAGIAIYDQRDQLVYGTNTMSLGVSLAPLDRLSRVEFVLPSLPMLDGRFFVTIAVHSPDERTHYHWLERKLKFEVQSSGEEVGLVHLRANCRVTTPDPAVS